MFGSRFTIYRVGNGSNGFGEADGSLSSSYRAEDKLRIGGGVVRGSERQNERQEGFLMRERGME